MSHDPGPPGPVPLQAIRAALDPDTRVVPLGEITVVRTPTRPDLWEGNALHLGAPPEPADLDPLLAVWDERFGSVPGIEHLRVRWVEPAAGRDLGPLRAAAADRGLELDLTPHLELDELTDAGRLPPQVEIVPATDPRQLHGATVLFRHTDWGGDEEFWRQTMEGRRRLAEEGRAVTYLAVRWGIPVGTAALCWEPLADVGPDHAGLAVIEDVVVHPAHRGAGVGSALVRTAVERHLAGHPRARVVLRTDDAVDLYRRLGFVRTATVGGLSRRAAT